MKIPYTLFLTVSSAVECVCVARNSTRNFNFLVAGSVFLASSVDTIFTAHCDSWTSRISEDGSVRALRMTQSRGRMWNSEQKQRRKTTTNNSCSCSCGLCKKVDFSLMSRTFFLLFHDQVWTIRWRSSELTSFFLPSHTFTSPAVVVNRRQT